MMRNNTVEISLHEAGMNEVPSFVAAFHSPCAPPSNSSCFSSVMRFDSRRNMSLFFAALLPMRTYSFTMVPTLNFSPDRQVMVVMSSPNFSFWGSFGGETRRRPALTNHQQAASSSSTIEYDSPKKKRIGIVGGGIAGVTVAHALTKRSLDCDITILEANMPKKEASNPTEAVDRLLSPVWDAAVARNGNSIVPGASFYVFSQPSELKHVLVDTVKEWIELVREKYKERKASSYSAKTDPTTATVAPLVPLLKRHDDFEVLPPYFALHPLACLGPNATSAERWSFVNFVRHYLYQTIFRGHQASQRAQHLLQLAQANRDIYLDEIKNNSDLATKIGHSKGFLNLHRTRENAQKNLEQVKSMGEEAELLEWEQVIEQEPRLDLLPASIKPMWAVRRQDDYTANCNAFMRHWIRQCQSVGVKHEPNFKVDTIQRVGEQFRVINKDGSYEDFDYVVLAAGVHTPILAGKLGVAKYCPTYPLRGFSLSFFAWWQEDKDKKPANTNLLKQPFKLDAMYCSSVSPWMGRWVGFGEFAGYHATADDVPSIGPTILSRYAKTLFPDAIHTNVTDTVACFRPMSPDDLPLIGEVDAVPGLFLHTGHGSLGWTIGMATGELCAQEIEEKLKGTKTDVFRCHGREFQKTLFTPNRFVN